jgi:hypothetical protein
MKYAVNMASGEMVYIPTFIKIGSGLQKLLGGYTDTNTHTHTHTKVISQAYFYFFKMPRVG